MITIVRTNLDTGVEETRTINLPITVVTNGLLKKMANSKEIIVKVFEGETSKYFDFRGTIGEEEYNAYLTMIPFNAVLSSVSYDTGNGITTVSKVSRNSNDLVLTVGLKSMNLTAKDIIAAHTALQQLNLV